MALFALMSGLFTLAVTIAALLVEARHGLHAVLATLAGAGGSALLASFAIGATLVVLGVLARRVWFGRGVLETFDALAIFIACFGFDLILFGGPPSERHELTLALISTHMLLGRASIVPSTWKRSAIVGAAAFAPLIAATCICYHSSSDEAFSWGRAAYVTQWGVIAVVSSARMSWRLYTLQRQVEAARRFGQYTLEQKIGEGGMGEVFRARHALLLRPTALKLLPRSRAGAHAIARFEREVQMTSRLTHPSTIQIYDYGRAEDGTFYYAMEFLDGVTLEQLVLRDGAQHAGRVARILADVCASLAEAHDAGLVHRDVKAQNVMLCARGGAYDVVKVLDFGLVKTEDEEPREPRSLAGTPAYMAPESIAHPGQFDAQSDLYAVGALGYFLLAGAPVFVGGSAFELLGQHLHAAPVPPSERAGLAVPSRLERLVLACLAKSPGDRPASARLFRAELLALEDVLATWSDEDAAGWWRESDRANGAGRASSENGARSGRTLLLPVNTSNATDGES